MELKTMVLDGIEYVLIPKDVFDKTVGVESPPEPSKITDFEPEPVEEVVEEAVTVVNSVARVKKAQGSEYGYAKRLKDRSLQPEDVMVVKTDVEKMPESPEIARNDFKNNIPPGKWGFYGPGAERDLG